MDDTIHAAAIKVRVGQLTDDELRSEYVSVMRKVPNWDIASLWVRLACREEAERRNIPLRIQDRGTV